MPALHQSGDKSPHSKLAGVLPVFQTPFHDDESIDFDTLGREIQWLYDCGADGIVMAMVSETLRLASEEREQLAAAACGLGRDRGAVIISVGAESSHTAERYARHAEAAGADAVMAIPPVSITLGDDELLRYYSRIVRAISIPVIVQDASGYVGRPMPIALQARLLEEFGDHILYKPEANPIGPRLTALLQATGGRARIFEGSGGIALVEAFARGIVGTMPGADLIEAQVALWRALAAGDTSRVNRIYPPLCALVSLQTGLDGFLAIEKHLLVKQGILKNVLVRGPVGYMLDEETRKQVDHWFAVLQAAIQDPRIVEGSENMTTITLGRIAHARSGDKGNHANLGVIAYTPQGFEFLRTHLTPDCVAEYFAGLGLSRVERFELPRLWALNFLLYDALAGGASQSLRIDTQGKLLGTAVLDLPLPAPTNLQSLLPP